MITLQPGQFVRQGDILIVAFKTGVMPNVGYQVESTRIVERGEGVHTHVLQPGPADVLVTQDQTMFRFNIGGQMVSYPLNEVKFLVGSPEIEVIHDTSADGQPGHESQHLFSDTATYVVVRQTEYEEGDQANRAYVRD